jgi:protein involved in polysaccharide export with SLBB domain
VRVTVLGEQTRNGIYVLEDGTTLTELLALAGGTARSSETELEVVRATVRVLRLQGGQRVPIYVADAEELVLEPSAHPDLQDGDLIDVDVELERRDPPFTFRDGVEVASRVASLISVAILLVTRL